MSTQKIFVFVAFISVAIFSSLFVFQASHKEAANVVNNEQATIFTTGRDLKPFELTTTNGDKFTQQNLQQHWTLLFFGFTHCQSICPTTLNLLKHVYPELHDKYPNLQVVFVSLDPERDNKSVLSHYVHSFHADFIPASGKIEDIRKLQSQLGIFSSVDSAAPSGDYQIQHSSSILLIAPNGKWVSVLKYNLTPQQFTDAILLSTQQHA